VAKVCTLTAPSTWTVTGIVASGNTLGTCMANGAWAAVPPLAATASAAPTGNFLAAGTIRLTRSGNHLFIGFTVDQDADLSDQDLVVIAFDKENNDAWNDGDFFLRLIVGPATPLAAPGGGTDCKLAVVVEYYRYSAGNGFIKETTAGVASAVVAKAAYDYEINTDAEKNLWNLEVDMPIGVTIGATKYFDLPTSGTNVFGIGAYLFLDDGHLQTGQTGMVLRWPDSIGDRQISQWDLNAPALDPTKLADASLSSNCFDMNFANTALPLTSNSMTEVNKTGPTRFTLWYWFAGPPSTGPGAGPNQGNLHVKVYRTTASTSWETIFDNTQPASINGYNQAHHATFDMNIAGGTTATDFCSDVYLENWQFDDDKSDGSNHTHVNYIPFATSDVTREFDLPVNDIPGLAAGATTSLLLNLSTTNDPNGKQLGLSGQGASDRNGGLFILAGVSCLGAAGMLRRRKGVALVLVFMGAGALINGCRPKTPSAPIGTDRWDFTNARELGLTPMPGEPGWYRMPARQGEAKRGKLHFVGRPLPYETVSDSLAMAMDSSGRPAVKRIAVRPGQVVSVFAPGTIDVDGAGPLQPTDAAGLIRKDESPRSASLYPLARSRYVPAENVGALIGSFDGLRTSFVIGTNGSFVVPNGTDQLTLTTNGLASDYRSAVGRYSLKWIVTEGPKVPTATSYGFDTPLDQPTFVPGWLVLTSVNVKTFYEVPVKDAKTGTTLMGRAALGEVHFSIYESHVQ
jgi:hypothetical protein